MQGPTRPAEHAWWLELILVIKRLDAPLSRGGRSVSVSVSECGAAKTRHIHMR